MTIRLNEAQLKGIVSRCVRRVLKEEDEIDNATKKDQIDAAWKEFESKPWLYTDEEGTDLAYGNHNIHKDQFTSDLYGLDAQKPYIHNDASNSAHTSKNFGRNLARSHGDNKDAHNIFGLSDYNEWDGGADFSDMPDMPPIDKNGRVMTRGKYYGFENHVPMDESVRRAVRKTIRKYARR